MDSEDLLSSEAVALRVRGTLNLTSGQNENDLHIAFKHLIEKVGASQGGIASKSLKLVHLSILHNYSMKMSPDITRAKISLNTFIYSVLVSHLYKRYPDSVSAEQ